jgi:hypothetical protein
MGNFYCHITNGKHFSLIVAYSILSFRALPKLLDFDDTVDFFVEESYLFYFGIIARELLLVYTIM